MSILNRAKNIWRLSAKSTDLGSALFGQAEPKAMKRISNIQEEMAAYGGYAALVSACVDAITRDVVSQKLVFKNIKTGEVIDDNRVPKQILAPYVGNWRGLWLRDVLNVVVPSKLLTGNAFIWNTTGSAYGEASRIKDAFIPIASNNVKINLNVNGEGVDYYTVKLGGMAYDVTPDEIIHIRQTPIYNPFVGVGNVTKARLLIEGEYAATEYINAFLNEAQGAPSMIMMDKTPMEHDQKVRMADMLKQKWSSKIMYMNVEDAAIIQNSLLTRDFDFLEKRKFDMESVLAVFGVPKLVLGIPEGSNRATSTNQIPLYYKSTVNPCIKEISYFLTNHHVKRYSNDIEVCLEPHASGDIAEVEKMLASGIITPNRAAEIMGQEIDISDQSRNAYYVPAGLAISAHGKESLDGEDEDSDSEMGKAVLAGDISEKSLADPRNVDHIVQTFNKSTGFKKLYQAKFLRRSLLSRNVIEEKFTGIISEYFKRVGAEVVSIFKKGLGVKSDSIPDDILEVQKYVEIFLASNIQAEKEMLKPLHTAGVQRAINDTNEIAGSGISPSFSNPFVKGAVENLANDITGKLTETTKRDMRRIFARAINDGWDISRMQAEIERKFTQYQGSRARTIARTEARASWDAGAAVSYIDIGVKKIDVVGCKMFEYNSDCGRQDIPVELIKSLKFHPNHIGALVPSSEEF
jgi:HK97 family phage portal protein